MSRKTENTPKRRDWFAIRDARLAGMSLEGLALKEGITPGYVAEGLQWLERLMPHDRTAILRAKLERHLEAAESLLADGKPLEAERQARAVTAMLKAASGVEDWARLAEAARQAERSEAQTHAHTRDALLEELRRRLSRLDGGPPDKNTAGAAGTASGIDGREGGDKGAG
ncbi:MAG: hypothetical protein JJU26_04045 [Oceanicaulis sp.]|uniref:hypothetical protein n=1 Tax=Glycocaulis sp. TaxID=1969725 RepID=UPI0025C28216|nr:hypothetical protein [Glycocaulis sp.]MCC5980873.1 hypothetical protein [Oceanicaulis sp.]MCH8522618.1 hypothetical protein [Glycocaulis sp.]